MVYIAFMLMIAPAFLFFNWRVLIVYLVVAILYGTVCTNRYSMSEKYWIGRKFNNFTYSNSYVNMVRYFAFCVYIVACAVVIVLAPEKMPIEFIFIVIIGMRVQLGRGKSVVAFFLWEAENNVTVAPHGGRQIAAPSSEDRWDDAFRYDEDRDEDWWRPDRNTGAEPGLVPGDRRAEIKAGSAANPGVKTFYTSGYGIAEVARAKVAAHSSANRGAETAFIPRDGRAEVAVFPAEKPGADSAVTPADNKAELPDHKENSEEPVASKRRSTGD